MKKGVADSQSVLRTWQEQEDYIRRLCSYKLRNDLSCLDDCMQEIFIAFSQAVAEKTVIRNPKAWLTAVANNICCDCLQERAKLQKRTLPLLEQSVTKRTQDTDYLQLIENISDEAIEEMKERVLSVLNEEERILYFAYYENEKSVKELAEILECSPNYIKQKLHRLRLKIKAQIKQEFEKKDL